MSYSFTEDFYATMNIPLDTVNLIEIKGTALTDDMYFSVKTTFLNARTGKPDYTITKFDDLEAALEYLGTFRDMLATVMELDALPYRLEIAGLDVNGNTEVDVTYVITKTEGAELPYRLQQYKKGEPSSTFTEFRSLIDAVYEVQELNAERVSPVECVRTYDFGYRCICLENEDCGSNQPMYKMYIEQKIGEGVYKALPYWYDTAYSPQSMQNAIDNFERCYRAQLMVEADSVTLDLTDNRQMLLTANVTYANGQTKTISSSSSFDDMVTEGYLDNILEARGNPAPTKELMAQLYEEFKDDFCHRNVLFTWLANKLADQLMHSSVEGISEAGFRFSPLAWNKIRELNPSRASHTLEQSEKQKNVKKTPTMEER